MIKLLFLACLTWDVKANVSRAIFIIFIYLFCVADMHLPWCICGGQRRAFWRELILSFYHVNLRDWTRVFGFDSKHPYLPTRSHPLWCFLNLPFGHQEMGAAITCLPEISFPTACYCFFFLRKTKLSFFFFTKTLSWPILDFLKKDHFKTKSLLPTLCGLNLTNDIIWTWF